MGKLVMTGRKRLLQPVRTRIRTLATQYTPVGSDFCAPLYTDYCSSAIGYVLEEPMGEKSVVSFFLCSLLFDLLPANFLPLCHLPVPGGTIFLWVIA